ncbi:MAG: outer membrane beta-barrel protein [bacterium]
MNYRLFAALGAIACLLTTHALAQATSLEKSSSASSETTTTTVRTSSSSDDANLSSSQSGYSTGTGSSTAMTTLHSNSSSDQGLASDEYFGGKRAKEESTTTKRVVEYDEMETATPEQRYRIGQSVMLFAGLNLAQMGNLNIKEKITGGNFNEDFDQQQRFGPVGGLRWGYTWGALDGVIDPTSAANTFSVERGKKYVNGDFKCMPAVDLEFLYMNLNALKGTKNNAFTTGVKGTETFNLTSYILSANPMLKMQLGMVRPYFGAGFGGAYLKASDMRITLPGISTSDASKSDSDIAMVCQGFVGTEIFIAEGFALTTEYKYLHIIDPVFDTSIAETKLKNFGNHIMTVGARFYY